MQTREEFIDAHWEEALVIDARMREAAKACVKNFLGEEQEIPVLISQEALAKYDSSIDYFVLLAYAYSMTTLDQRILKSRSFIEVHFQMIILQSAIGDECVKVVASTDYAKFSIRKAMLGNKVNGEDRKQVGLELSRMQFSMFQSLPISYDEMTESNKAVPKKSALGIWTALWRKSLTNEQRIEREEKQAAGVQGEIARICKVWNLKCEGPIDLTSWMLTDFETCSGTA